MKLLTEITTCLDMTVVHSPTVRTTNSYDPVSGRRSVKIVTSHTVLDKLQRDVLNPSCIFASYGIYSHERDQHGAFLKSSNANYL